MNGSDNSPLTLGTAGHIDHGKTVLIEALTGVNTDRLPEEQARGISIELGFASLDLPSGRALSVVDVPGHERFVRTMVAGATGVDLFLLVVAADDGVMPQTREHLAVMEALEISAGVVAITKTDIVGPEGVELAVEEVTQFLSGTRYQEAPMVPVCAPAGENLDQLLLALDSAASSRSGREAAQSEMRLHVDRVFSLKGIGTVVTGTLWSGALGAGDEVRIEPSKRRARVRSVEVHGRKLERAKAGQRVAVNLAGLQRDEVERGDVLTSSSSEYRPTYLIDAAVELARGIRPLARGERVQLHHGTRHAPARLAPVEGDVLQPGRRSYVQLRLERPIVPARGDRFVLRQVAPPDTIGGGVVVDPAPRKHGAAPEQAERLRLLESGDALRTLEAQLETAASGIGEAESQRDLLAELSRSGRARVVGVEQRRYFAASQLTLARERLLGAIRELGRDRPVSRGALADTAGISGSAAQALLEELVAEGAVVAHGPRFRLANAMELEDPRIERLDVILRADFLEPRSPQALAAELGVSRTQVSELLERAALDGRLERVKPGIYYHPDALAEARHRVVLACEREGSVSIASLRDALATSRKYAQALLEHFDATRVTRRQGDVHVLRRGISLAANRSSET